MAPSSGKPIPSSPSRSRTSSSGDLQELKPQSESTPSSRTLPNVQDGPYFTIVCVMLGTAAWSVLIMYDIFFTPREPKYAVPEAVSLSHRFCGVAYFCSLLISILHMFIDHDPRKDKLHVLSCYVSTLSAASNLLLHYGVTSIQLDVNSMLFLPSRWLLYIFTMPAIWTILTHVSCYNLRQRMYVLFLNAVMLVTGGMATIPGMSWPQKVFWMAFSCVPFPELCHHLWRMLSDPMDAILAMPLDSNTGGLVSWRALAAMRVFSQFSYQFFPAVYFAAFQGCLPVTVCEPLWSLCDWCLKMLLTSSLMEANFVTAAQRHDAALKKLQDTASLQRVSALAEAVQHRDDFLSKMSHELRTPLHGIIGLSDGLINGSNGVLSRGVVNSVTNVKRSGQRLLHLVDDILDAARVKNGQVLIKHETVDMNLLVQQVIDLSRPLAADSVVMEARLTRVPLIQGDASRIIQILSNLVVNACKFTKRGHITIYTKVAEAGDYVLVSVVDTGIGIEESMLEEIFQPFEQADMSITRTVGGTGLGLHLVKELMAAHNGEIDVISQMHAGSTFTCSFPVEQPSAKGGMPAHPTAGNLLHTQGAAELAREKTISSLVRVFLDSPDPKLSEVASAEGIPFARHKVGGPRAQVMCVENSRVSQMVLINLLARGTRPLEVVCCDNGAHAFEWLTAVSALPDVIILEHMLPDMSGEDVLRALSAKYGRHRIPVLLASGNAETPYDLASHYEGLTLDQYLGVVEEPYTRSNLLGAISAALRSTDHLGPRQPVSGARRGLRGHQRPMAGLLLYCLVLTRDAEDGPTSPVSRQTSGEGRYRTSFDSRDGDARRPRPLPRLSDGPGMAALLPRSTSRLGGSRSGSSSEDELVAKVTELLEGALKDQALPMVQLRRVGSTFVLSRPVSIPQGSVGLARMSETPVPGYDALDSLTWEHDDAASGRWSTQATEALHAEVKHVLGELRKVMKAVNESPPVLEGSPRLSLVIHCSETEPDALMDDASHHRLAMECIPPARELCWASPPGSSFCTRLSLEMLGSRTLAPYIRCAPEHLIPQSWLTSAFRESPTHGHDAQCSGPLLSWDDPNPCSPSGGSSGLVTARSSTLDSRLAPVQALALSMRIAPFLREHSLSHLEAALADVRPLQLGSMSAEELECLGVTDPAERMALVTAAAHLITKITLKVDCIMAEFEMADEDSAATT